MAYCGFIVGCDGVRAQPEKLAVVHVWPEPTNPDQVRSFIGMCAFYQRFVPSYAGIAAPLYSLLKKNMPWRWGPEHKNAFQTLKAQLLQAPVLAIADPTKPYVVHTDASNVAIGATLSQVDASQNMRLKACI